MYSSRCIIILWDLLYVDYFLIKNPKLKVLLSRPILWVPCKYIPCISKEALTAWIRLTITHNAYNRPPINATALFQNGRHSSRPLNEATRANLQVNKRILKWRPVWNKVYYITEHTVEQLCLDTIQHPCVFSWPSKVSMRQFKCW